MKHLNDKRVVQSTDVPTKLIKEFCDLFSKFIYKSINHCITEGSFIANFKVAEFSPLLYLSLCCLNIDLCDSLFDDYSSDFANFADDTTPCECGPTLNEVMDNLEITTEKMF